MVDVVINKGIGWRVDGGLMSSSLWNMNLECSKWLWCCVYVGKVFFYRLIDFLYKFFIRSFFSNFLSGYDIYVSVGLCCFFCVLVSF